jgi:DNA-binding transcriptional LysR family regulator
MMSLDAAVQGMGVALESTTIAQSHIESGRLVPLFPLRMSTKLEAHFAVYPQRNAERETVKAFLAWMAKQAKPSAKPKVNK